MPVFPYWPALEQVGEEKGDCPDEDDRNHSPYSWFDEGALEDPKKTRQRVERGQ